VILSNDWVELRRMMPVLSSGGTGKTTRNMTDDLFAHLRSR
jgi:molybdopterin biosynthesis enzyme MoaB